MDKYEELKQEINEIKDYLTKFYRDYEDTINNLDENNFTDEFRKKINQ